MDANPYKRRLEDLDPARRDPSATIEHHEPVRARPSPYTVEGFIHGVGELAAAAAADEEPRRSHARLLGALFLLAVLTPVLIQLLGLLPF